MRAPRAVPLPVTARARLVEPEWLDELPQSDPRAAQSRRDLRKVNAFMGNARLLCAMLRPILAETPVRTVAEIGGGDGSLMLRVARGLSSSMPGVSLELVDRQNLLDAETARQFASIGWKARAVQSDVFDWIRSAEGVDLIVANLFLHHFTDTRLAELLEGISGKAQVVAACEPRRLPFPALAGGSVVLIGCNSVTRHDAIASVRAGFIGQELSALWPEQRGWELRESNAALASHCFFARRLERKVSSY